jgi:hypothetical protein
MNGACRQVELLATKTFHHVDAQAASVVLTSPFRFSVPSVIPVIAGNAGNHEAHLTYVATAGTMVDCLYRGGSSVSHPVSATDLQKGEQFLFVSCADGANSGDIRIATAFTLRIDGDERDPSRVIVARLVLDEIAPCGVVDAGADADAAKDVTASDVDGSRDVDASDVVAEAGPDVDADALVDAEASADAEAAVDAESGIPADADASQTDAAPPQCGDSVRDPDEECDLGLGGSPRALCTADCRVRDVPAIEEPFDAAVAPGRTLGEGRHPVATSPSGEFAIVFVESDASPLHLSLTTFTSQGVASDKFVPVSTGTTPLLMSHPVVAALPDGTYAVAFTDFNGDGDELGVALRLVDPAIAPNGSPAHANVTTTFSQYDPDLIATSSGLVTAWVDDSDGTTNPKVKYRTFAFDLTPTSDELPLAVMSTSESEGDVALAPWGTSWAAAWRADDGGVETLRVRSGAAIWNIGPYLPGPVGSRPAMAELDETHLLVIYAEGTDPADTGVANGSKIRVAVLDSSAPGAATPLDISSTLAVGLSQDQPNAVRAGGQVFVAWRTESPLGIDAGSANGEELWLKSIGWNGAMIDLSTSEIPLPRSSAHRLGDQRRPALAAGLLAPTGVELVTAFDDLGKVFDAGEGNGDVVVEAIPLPILRLPGDP